MLDLKIVCEDPKYMPTYANDTDACMDLKVKINLIDPYAAVELKPHQTMTFGTGIKVAIPEGYVMLVLPRSSTGFKLNCMLSNTTGVIDAGYRDEIHIGLYNFGDKPIYLDDAQRVAQFLIIPRPKINLEMTVDNEDFRTGDRGGGIGSTGV